MEKIPMTAAGYAVLETELKHRQQVERPRIIQQITDARTHGDLSENAEYHAAKESQSINEGRIAELEDAALVHRLGLLGGMILGVLRQVAERARVGDRLDDPRPLDLLAVAQLLLERRQALPRHRYFFHHVVSS